MNPGKIFDWHGSIIAHLRYPAFLEQEASGSGKGDEEHQACGK